MLNRDDLRRIIKKLVDFTSTVFRWLFSRLFSFHFMNYLYLKYFVLICPETLCRHPAHTNYQPHLLAASLSIAQERLCTAVAVCSSLIASFKVIIVRRDLWWPPRRLCWPLTLYAINRSSEKYHNSITATNLEWRLVAAYLVAIGMAIRVPTQSDVFFLLLRLG